jgi:membrane associated rhomboid family serine protease
LSIAFLILVATVAASLFTLYVSPRTLEKCLFRPYWFERKRQYASLVTSGFVHGDFTHLLFNMLAFWFFAFQVERRAGSVAFAVLYFAGLVLANLGTWRKHRHDPRYASLGASGAVAAVLFASIIYFPEQKLMILPIPVPIPGPLFAVLYVAYSWYASRQAPSGINHDAHLGGALVGLAFVLLVEPSAFREFARVVLG